MPQKFKPADARRIQSITARKTGGGVAKDSLAAIVQSTTDKRSPPRPPQQPRPIKPRPPNGPSTTGEKSGKRRGSNPPGR